MAVRIGEVRAAGAATMEALSVPAAVGVTETASDSGAHVVASLPTLPARGRAPLWAPRPDLPIDRNAVRADRGRPRRERPRRPRRATPPARRWRGSWPFGRPALRHTNVR